MCPLIFSINRCQKKSNIDSTMEDPAIRRITRDEQDRISWVQSGVELRVVSEAHLIHCHDCRFALTSTPRSVQWYFVMQEYRCEYCFLACRDAIYERLQTERDRTKQMPHLIKQVCAMVEQHRHFAQLSDENRTAYREAKAISRSVAATSGDKTCVNTYLRNVWNHLYYGHAFPSEQDTM